MNVGEVAALAGVTVRTLHHYDRIGLLSPSGRTAAGYRQYSPADLDRLHQVLLYRELGFPLEEVATLLDDPAADPEAHLRRQHALLRDRLDRTSAMVAAVEKEMEARAMGISLTPEERFEVFGEHDPAQYDAEVEERWGETDAYAQSKRKTAAYSKDDWLRDQGRAGGDRHPVRPGDAVRRRGRLRARRWTSPRRTGSRSAAGSTTARPRCTPAWAGCTSRTSGSPRTYEAMAPGLAQYVSTANQANAARQGVTAAITVR